jgi:hypothetical protein
MKKLSFLFFASLLAIGLFSTACNSPLPEQEPTSDASVREGQGKEGVSPVEDKPDAGPTDTASEPTPDASSETGSPDKTVDTTVEVLPEDGGTEPVPESGADTPPDGPSTEQWTWARCRRAFLNKTLSAAQKQSCDRRHSKAPTTFEYGLRIYLLNPAANPQLQAQIKTLITNVNNLLKGSGLRFRVVQTLVLQGLKLDGQDGKKYSFNDIAADMAKYLQFKDSTPAAVFQEFQDRLKKGGVDTNAVNKLKATDQKTLGQWFLLLSRTDPEHIPVFVIKAFQRSGVAGLATGSVTSGISAIGQSHVQVKSVTAGPVWAHELGHIFGLGHTHAQSIGSTMSSPTALVNFTGLNKAINRNEPLKVLQNRLGTQFQKAFKAPWLPYSAQTSAVNASILYFASLKRFWQWPRLTYKEGYGEFSGLNEFVQWGKSGKKMYYKNFVRNPATGQTLDWKGNNCKYDRAQKRIRCRYESPASFKEGNASFLDKGICFQSGTGSNLMSYITPPRINGIPNKGHLSKEQIDLIHFTRFLPARLLLRNYALK